MNRGFYALLRAVIGIIFIAILLRFLGITWTDVHTFISNSTKSFLDIAKLFHGIAQVKP